MPLTLLLEVIAVAAITVLVYSQVNHLNLSLDEGIYLHGAQRTIAGEHPYADWFVFTGPGTFWLFSALFRCVSLNFSAAHCFLSLEIGLICGSIYWITAGHLNKLTAVAATASFLALALCAFDYRLYVNHRWDSTCCVAIGVSLLLSKRATHSYFAAGLFAGSAIIFTPPTALILISLLAALLFLPSFRKIAVPFGFGALVPLVSALGLLASQHSLQPMLSSFQWAGQHYQQANSVPYGFESTTLGPASILHRSLIEIPSVLPLAAATLLIWILSKQEEMLPPAWILAAAGAGAILSCYPRWAANQLLFTVPIFLCLTFFLASNVVSSKSLNNISWCLIVSCALWLLVSIANPQLTAPVITQLRTVSCNSRDRPNVEFATAVVQPRETLFVYPYQPIWYSLTGGINTTSYDFLQPGMMTLQDEAKVLSQLEANPPQWVIWHNLPPRTVLAYWPNSYRTTLRFIRIEQFIRARYRQVQPPDPKFHYAIAVFHRIEAS